jgi:hypothetical protein
MDLIVPDLSTRILFARSMNASCSGSVRPFAPRWLAGIVCPGATQSCLAAPGGRNAQAILHGAHLFLVEKKKAKAT